MLTGNRTVSMGSNNLAFTGSGKVGVGTASPGAKLEINNGSTSGAIKIVDGTQGAGKILMSDADGLASWSLKGNVVEGAAVPGNISSTAWTYTGSTVTIPPYTTKCIVYAMSQFLNTGAAPRVVNAFLGFSTSSSSYINASPNGQQLYLRQYVYDYFFINSYVTDIVNNTGTSKVLYMWTRSDYTGVSYQPNNTINDVRLFAVIY